MIPNWQTLLPWTGRSGAHYECRQCGTTVDVTTDECPACGSTNIVEYEVS